MTKMKTMNIRGKEYVPVVERVKAFKQACKAGSIKTKATYFAETKIWMVKAKVYDADMLIATGHAMEKEGSNNINKDNALENCETSAIGRALGFAGFGVDSSVATYEDVKHAQQQQEAQVEANRVEGEQLKELENLWGILDKTDADRNRLMNYFNRQPETKFSDLTKKEAETALRHLKNQREIRAKQIQGNSKRD